MEKLTQEQLQTMSREQVAARFNILVDKMQLAYNEVRNLPNYPQDVGKGGGNLHKQFRRIGTYLTRPFAATQFSDDGVHATMLKLNAEPLKIQNQRITISEARRNIARLLDEVLSEQCSMITLLNHGKSMAVLTLTAPNDSKELLETTTTKIRTDLANIINMICANEVNFVIKRSRKPDVYLIRSPDFTNEILKQWENHLRGVESETSKENV